MVNEWKHASKRQRLPGAEKKNLVCTTGGGIT